MHRGNQWHQCIQWEYRKWMIYRKEYSKNLTILKETQMFLTDQVHHHKKLLNLRENVMPWLKKIKSLKP
jgi:hypothetical protein